MTVQQRHCGIFAVIIVRLAKKQNKNKTKKTNQKKNQQPSQLLLLLEIHFRAEPIGSGPDNKHDWNQPRH